MTIFTVLMPAPTPALVAKIQSEYANEFLRITDTQWLISGAGTVTDVAARLGIHDLKNPNAQAVGDAIVFSISSYFGRAPPMVWEWLKVKMEARSGG